MLFVTLVFSGSLMAQKTTISGSVNDATIALPGVNVIEKGTTNGVTTDFDGNYSIDVSEGAILVFSYVGFEAQEVVVGNQTDITVSLQANTQALEEVVVTVGYGTSVKRELTGSVSTIKKQAIQSVIAGNPTSSLQGKLAGVQVENFGGQPGGSTNVFIRGVNSLSNAAPLYVVDGLFVDNMDYINPNDIVDISVLKDAAASAIYGARAANGVVLINTNRGVKNSDVKVTLSTRYGFDTPSKKLDYIGGQEYVNYLNQRFTNDGESTQVTWNGTDTDWQEENLSQAAVEEIGFGISGGGENSSFYASGNYFNQDGILVGSGYKRINFRVNSRFEFGKFTLTESIGITEGKLQENNWFGWDGVSVPTLNVRNANNEGGFEAPSLDVHGPGGVNQFGLASLEDNLVTTRTVFGNFKLDYDVTDDLKASVNFGVDYLSRNSFQFTPTYFMSSVDAVLNVNQQNDLTDFRQDNVNVLVEPTLNYKKEIGNHKVGAILGYTYFRESQKGSGVFGQGTPANSIQTISALPASDQLILLGSNNYAGLQSYFGRVNYSYKGKYILSATVRQDESSRFDQDNRAGVFPSFSGAWNISDEDFFSSSKISYFKLRASYGELGSYPDVFYPTQAVFLANQSNTSFAGSLAQGLAQTTLADPNLIWETTKTFDIGIDLSFMDDKLFLTADYFSKSIEDVLVAINVPSTTGVSLPVTRNAGTLINKGLEVDLRYKKISGAVSHAISTNFAFNLESKADEIPNPILGPAIDEDLRVVNRTLSGQPIGAYYGFLVDDKVDPNTGDFVRLSDELQVIGDPVPDFTFGINYGATYKNWDLNLAFNGVYGNEIYNLSRYYSILWQDGGKLSDVLDSWTPSNTDTSVPRASISDPAGNKAPSSFFVEDGSYFRLRNLDVGYTINQNSLGVDWVDNVRVSLNVQNLFVLTNYSGYDPDVSSTNGGRANRNTGVPGLRTPVNPLLSRGLDARAYPNARTVMVGIQATF